MSMWFGMDGKPISSEEASKLFKDPDARRVAETTLPDGTWISTVLLSCNHNYSEIGPPIIFETMVFESKGGGGDLDCERYATKEEALEGHARMVEKWQSKEVLEGAMKKRKPGKWGNE